MQDTYPYYLAGEALSPNTDLAVTNKYNGQPTFWTALATRNVVEQAVAAAAEAAEECGAIPPHVRATILHQVECRLRERRDEFAQALVIEVGKSVHVARGEVDRAIETFHVAAEETTRIYGQYIPLSFSPRSEGCNAILKRVPVGPCGFITPFNFPLNLVAHKVAPAIASGCPFVLKPASYTPVSALLVGEILTETDWPAGGFSILPCSAQDAEPIVVDPRINLLSFTGSAEVGWELKAKAGKKRVALELGGNAGCIVDRDANLNHVVARIVFGAFYQAGQSCISVQRVFVHRSIYQELKTMLVSAIESLAPGDPMDESTTIEPLITEDEAKRVESWVEAATSCGATLLCGGQRKGNLYMPTLLENAPVDSEVYSKEVFGPVATLTPFDTFEEACSLVNDSDFGLQAGVFTNDLNAAFYAFNELEVGGVIINDVPSVRVDAMPYGGVKNSGTGREGIRYAIEEMTEPRLMVLNRIGEPTS